MGIAVLQQVVESFAGALDHIHMSGDILRMAAVELENRFNGAEGGHIDEDRVGDDIPCDALVAGGRGEGAAVGEDFGLGEVRLKIAEVEGLGRGDVACAGDLTDITERSSHHFAGVVAVGSDLDHEADDSKGFV